MREAGFDFDIMVPEVEEAHDENLTCDELTMANAKLKAAAVAEHNPDSLVIGADTLVYLQRTPLGKPRDMEDAATMLTRLSGKTHQVCTGVVLVCTARGIIESFTVISDVTFKHLTPEIIRDYHSRIEPLDKAGAYAVQDESAMIIQEVRGSWSNVKGLPMEKLREKLAEFSVYPVN